MLKIFCYLCSKWQTSSDLDSRFRKDSERVNQLPSLDPYHIHDLCKERLHQNSWPQFWRFSTAKTGAASLDRKHQVERSESSCEEHEHAPTCKDARTLTRDSDAWVSRVHLLCSRLVLVKRGRIQRACQRACQLQQIFSEPAQPWDRKIFSLCWEPNVAEHSLIDSVSILIISHIVVSSGLSFREGLLDIIGWSSENDVFPSSPFASVIDSWACVWSGIGSSRSVTVMGLVK